jgi:hypothetical protein
MTSYDDKAAQHQDRVWRSFVHEDIDFPESYVRRATVHARSDMVLLVSHLSSMNGQLRIIRWTLLSIAVLLGIIAYHTIR